MSFSILVEYFHDEIPLPNEFDNETIWDKWLEEERSYWIYENPLGADGTIYDYWHVIACKLGLDLLRKVYNEGLKLKSLKELEQLEKELIEIKNYWETHKLFDINKNSITKTYLTNDIEVKEHLNERWNFVMKAISIAKEKEGILIIS
jgi:hypothetical protein